jgi:hypothetical protein
LSAALEARAEAERLGLAALLASIADA